MLSYLNLIPTSVVDSLETPRWILLAVCVIGVLLAYITDEGYSLLVGDDAKSATKDVKSNDSAVNENAAALVSVVSPYLPELLSVYLEKGLLQFQRNWSKYQLYRESMALKKKATTKRHFFYLLEKKILDLPVNDGETEVDSYIDCKNHMAQKWPFMWEVSDVKSDKIGCSGFECFPMSSYSYLGLLKDQRVQDAAIEAAKKWSTGNHGPRMLGGNMTILKDLEAVIATFFGRDDTLLCATGYLACMSACAAVSSENTVIFADSRLHASLRAGLKIGEGKTVWFKHNDFDDCEKKIKQFRSKYAQAWMVIESVYSMDGDICDLPPANALCQKYGMQMMIDEAHGLGVLGKTGRGVEEHFGMEGCATLIVGTFSKSIASIGGYITGPKKFISYLDFHAPGNVFSAPLPAYCAGGAIKSFELINNDPSLTTKAQENSRRLRKKLESGGGHWPKDYPENLKYELEGDAASTVLPVVFPDDIDRVMRVANELKQKGFMVSAVAYPACHLRRPRFRVTATSTYDEELMDNFVKALVEACIAEGASSFKQLVG